MSCHISFGVDSITAHPQFRSMAYLRVLQFAMHELGAIAGRMG